MKASCSDTIKALSAEPTTTKPGLFELAHQGTIFLDEIGELELKMQVKLLRVLDGVPYYRLGGVKKVSVDVRVVAATNQELEKAVAEGRFRSDLYHRLTQITVARAALRERVEDIAPLARHFLAQHDPSLRFTPAAVDVLEPAFLAGQYSRAPQRRDPRGGAGGGQ